MVPLYPPKKRPPPSRYRKPSLSAAYARPKPPPQRVLLYTIIAASIFVAILFFASPAVPVVQDLRLFHHTPIHKPPAQKNSTSGDAKWYSDWKWLHPFSFSITQDEDRSVLPPLLTRPPIYTFYDDLAEKDEKIKAAENKLLLLWRRAWWAQGFKPIILGRSEAMMNPLYERIQMHKLHPQMEAEIVRWSAWGQMGTGILANWLALPMGPYDDRLLSHFRRGEYSKLTRYEGLGTGLYSGEMNAINAAISEALKSPELEKSSSFFDVVKHETIRVDPKPDTVAFYSAQANAEHYKSITTTLAENKADGFRDLAQLMTSHLHLTFLNTFTDGFVVLTPYPEHTHLLTEYALALADALRSCPASPVPSSCPPNDPGCMPCSSISPPPVKRPESYTNGSTLYTIGTVPHPLTLASLLSGKKDITTRHIRRETDRDRWLSAVTEKTLGKDLGGVSRIVNLKEIVASDWGVASGLWMTEDPPPEHKDLEYHFGFAIAKFNVTGPKTDTLPLSKKEKQQVDRAYTTQKMLIANSKDVIKRKKAKDEKPGVREMVEAWNMADTEAWRFVRAFGARKRMERAQWEEEERAFAGGEEGRPEGWGRWFDRT